MAWTAGQDVTAALLNAHAPQEWTTYGNAATLLTASTTSPTLGTGSSTAGSYVKHGRLVHWRVQVVAGSSGTASGSGTYQILLPATPVAGTLTPIGHGLIQDGVGGIANLCTVLWSSGTVGHIYASGTGVTTSATFNLVANRRYLLTGAYEAAS